MYICMYGLVDGIIKLDGCELVSFMVAVVPCMCTSDNSFIMLDDQCQVRFINQCREATMFKMIIICTLLFDVQICLECWGHAIDF
jgi:hypothetical protein